MQVFRTIAAHAFVGTVAGLLIGLILALIGVSLHATENVLSVAFYAPTVLCPLYFALQAADELQDFEFTFSYLRHHGQE